MYLQFVKIVIVFFLIYTYICSQFLCTIEWSCMDIVQLCTVVFKTSITEFCINLLLAEYLGLLLATPQLWHGFILNLFQNWNYGVNSALCYSDFSSLCECFFCFLFFHIPNIFPFQFAFVQKRHTEYASFFIAQLAKCTWASFEKGKHKEDNFNLWTEILNSS